MKGEGTKSLLRRRTADASVAVLDEKGCDGPKAVKVQVPSRQVVPGDRAVLDQVMDFGLGQAVSIGLVELHAVGPV